MDYNKLLEACKEEILSASSIEEAYLVIYEYHDLLMEEYAREAEIRYAEREMEDEEYWDSLPF